MPVSPYLSIVGKEGVNLEIASPIFSGSKSGPDKKFLKLITFKNAHNQFCAVTGLIVF